MSKQSSFAGPMDRTREVLQRLSNQQTEFDEINLAVSGGTDSIVAADLIAILGPEYGFEADRVVHINTGAGIPQSKLAAKIIAEKHNLEFVEQGYRKKSDSLAERILENGWPGAYGGSPMTGGHGLEWANRKDKPMNAVYMMHDGMQLWVSGARKLESKKRQGNVPDSGVEKDKPRRVWVSPICGWTSEEKREYIKENNLPVSEAYQVLGFSGECTACAFDETGLLTNIQLLAPELDHALRSLAVWLYMRVKRGDVDLEQKRLCWGWETDDEKQPNQDQSTLVEENETAQTMVGCDEESCSTREKPSWVLELDPEQIVDRTDVVDAWENSVEGVAARFKA